MANTRHDDQANGWSVDIALGRAATPRKTGVREGQRGARVPLGLDIGRAPRLHMHENSSARHAVADVQDICRRVAWRGAETRDTATARRQMPASVVRETGNE